MSGWFSNLWPGWSGFFQNEFSSYAYVVVLLMGLAFVFLVLNPLAPTPKEPKQPTPPPREPEFEADALKSGKPHVLVVDDSAVVRVKLRRLLESAGYQVTVAENGLQAEVKLLKNRFNLLITDLEMPEMDGFGLIAAVHGSLETENLPIIAITGHEELQARVHACEGIYGLFQKPWNDRELLRRVAALVHLGDAMQHSVEPL
ncbi:MAG: response regulator [Betaproteobacteria bacterium]|nr:response regulator [Betaproteobacteria bacterium]